MTAAEAAAARTDTGSPWTRSPDHVRRRTGRAIWDAAEAEPDPLAAIDTARHLAADLVDRLTRTAPEGDHLATCLAHAHPAEPGLAADLPLTRHHHRTHTDREAAGTTFGSLLVLGALTNTPVAMILRTCHNPCPRTTPHDSTLQGWVLRAHHAHPLSRGAIRTIAHGGKKPHPALPQHPEEGTRYEKAYTLYTAGEEA